MPSPLDLVALPFVRTALAELALLAIAGGLLGTWIVLRRLAFFTHAVGAAAFPALIAAAPLGVSPQLAGAAAGVGYAAGVGGVSRRGRDVGLATALLLVACLAVGVVLASDVVDAGTRVDNLLFGTLLGLEAADLVFACWAAALAAFASLVLGRTWLAAGFDPDGTRTMAVPARRADAALLGVIALAAVAAVPAVGALLVASMFIVPAATARLLTSTLGGLILTSIGLALLQSVTGLYLALALDVSPGPALAVLGAVLYGAAAIAEAARSGALRVRPGGASRSGRAALGERTR